MATVTLRPDAAGDATNWTQPLGGANYTHVDEAVADDDTSYVERNDVQADDLYNITTDAALDGATISQIEVFVRDKYTAAGSSGSQPADPTLNILVKPSGGSVNAGTNKTVGSAYTDHSTVWTTNPTTTAAWTKSDIDALQVGIRSARTTGSGNRTRNPRVTQVYVVVTYSILPTSKSVSDSGSASDTKAIAASFTRTDSGTGSDAQALRASVNRADSGGATDILSALGLFSLADAAGGADSGILDRLWDKVTVAVTGFGVGISDSGSGSESLSAYIQASLSDSGTGADTAPILVTFPLSDPGSFTDALAALGLVNLPDSGVGFDALSAAAQLSLSDSGAAAELVALLKLIEDSGAATDGIAILAMVRIGDSGVALVKGFKNGLQLTYEVKYPAAAGSYTAKYASSPGSYAAKYPANPATYEPKYPDP